MITQLRSAEPTLLHYLLNADGGPGQESATITIDNATLPGGNGQWDAGEALPVPFAIGLLARRRFTFAVEIYNNQTPTAAAGQGQYLGRFDFVYDPVQTPTATQLQIFLPLIQRMNFKIEQSATGLMQAICQGTLCLVAEE